MCSKGTSNACSLSVWEKMSPSARGLTESKLQRIEETVSVKVSRGGLRSDVASLPPSSGPAGEKHGRSLASGSKVTALSKRSCAASRREQELAMVQSFRPLQNVVPVQSNFVKLHRDTRGFTPRTVLRSGTCGGAAPNVVRSYRASMCVFSSCRGRTPCSSSDSSPVIEEHARIIRDLGLLLPRNSGSAKFRAAPALLSGTKEIEVCRRRSKAFDCSCPDSGWCVPEESPRAWLLAKQHAWAHGKVLQTEKTLVRDDFSEKKV